MQPGSLGLSLYCVWQQGAAKVDDAREMRLFGGR